VIIGYVRYGSLKGLANMRLNWPLLVFFAFMMEASTYYLTVWFPDFFPRNQWLVSSLQYILLFIFISRNTQETSIAILGMGMLLNFFAISFNLGRMPVSEIIYDIPQFANTLEKINSGRLPEYFIMQGGEPFWFFGDVLPVPFMGIGIASIGDIFLAVGIFILIQKYMISARPKRAITLSQRVKTFLARGK